MAAPDRRHPAGFACVIFRFLSGGFLTPFALPAPCFLGNGAFSPRRPSWTRARKPQSVPSLSGFHISGPFVPFPGVSPACSACRQAFRSGVFSGCGFTVCEPCHVARRDREREQYAARRTAGLCGRCGTPAPSDAACCDRCARSAAKRSRKKAKNARSRQRYVQRRVRRLCIDCGASSQGASRCLPCARRSWARSGEHRGLPVLPPRVTVIEIATGVNHGTWERWEDVVMCLAFAKLSRDQVELIPDM